MLKLIFFLNISIKLMYLSETKNENGYIEVSTK